MSRQPSNESIKSWRKETTFLATDFLSDTEQQRIRSVLQRGGIHIQKLNTVEADGRKIKVKDGMIHHWIGSIFIPDVTLDGLLGWIQDYDSHH